MVRMKNTIFKLLRGIDARSTIRAVIKKVTFNEQWHLPIIIRIIVYAKGQTQKIVLANGPTLQTKHTE